MANTLCDQLNNARQCLLDLSLRNRLINFKPTKGRAIRIVDEIPREIYDLLVLQGQKMSFYAKSDEVKATGHVREPDQREGAKKDDQGKEESSEFPDDEAAHMWEMPLVYEEAADRHVDRFLQTTLKVENLQAQLFKIAQQASSVMEEQGYTVLYLALGFLEWSESSDAKKNIRAPLILIPVELDRMKVGKAGTLQWTGEDILTNISLQAKLREQGIELPEFDMPHESSGIDGYFQSVVNAVLGHSNWQVMPDLFLDFFSFTKFVMYKDLDPQSWSSGKAPYEHPLLQAILNPSLELQTGAGTEFSENDVDRCLPAKKAHHIFDADPSQIAVIENVKAGRSMVVEGPPGTGKSQTIVNLIAELLAARKRVLFVSEKMAALEVVQQRLNTAGLGDFCLDLHGRKSNKKTVLEDIQRVLSSPAPPSASFQEDLEELDRMKSELNGYAKALSAPFGAVGKSVSWLFGRKDEARRHFARGERDMPRLLFLDPQTYQQKDWAAAVTSLQSLGDTLRLVPSVPTSPWLGCTPGTVLPTDEAEIGETIRSCKAEFRELQAAIHRLCKFAAIKHPVTLLELPSVERAAEVMAASLPADLHVLRNKEWSGQPPMQAQELLTMVETFQSLQESLKAKFKPKALEKNISTPLGELKRLSRSPLRMFNRRFRELKRQFSMAFTSNPPRDIQEMIAALEGIGESQRYRDEIRTAESIGQALFGSYWAGEQSDPVQLRALGDWLVSFRRHLMEQVLTEHAVDLVHAGISSAEIERLVQEMKNAECRFVERRDHLANRIGLNYEAVFGTHPSHVPFSAWEMRMALWEAGLKVLHPWAQCLARMTACFETVAKPVAEAVRQALLEPEDLLPCFEGNVADHLLRLAFLERPDLAQFIGNLHEQKIERFQDLDRGIIHKNRSRLAHELYQQRTQIASGASSGSEAGILLGEFNRKRGHMPIRKLLSCTGDLIQQIKPCFMMSPLSIAQFLPPGKIEFDVIVFDEASQMKPEDALGALLRGHQVVVMGDTRQLPPTGFFDHLVEAPLDSDEEEDREATLSDMESLLHQCKRSFPTKTLRWHYRSRHESLMAVSNQEFYENRLLVYPSSRERSEELGLRFIHVPEGVYDRGKSSVNRMEARRVAAEAMKHFQRFPRKSLGVGTFNMKQQQAILDEVELQLREHPHMEEFFKSDREEHFFVKNIETIQGDERDAIFISMGYGFDPNRKLSSNFGPLNRQGGERRLNVLISRAREQCVVFSNFLARDLAVDDTSPFGLRALKVFLEYAETGSLSSLVPPGADTDSPFEDGVWEFLRGHGFEVRKQVGSAGFRIDLAVVDPKAPGQYVLAIECDGAKYHSSPVARDRDRLRQQVLEGLGWRIYRIWSTDWYRNARECQDALLRAVESALSESEVAGLEKEEFPLVSSILEPDNDLESEPSVAVHTSVQTLVEQIPLYEVCGYLGFAPQGELHDLPPAKLAEVVNDVVDVESPVHRDEVIRRIRDLWGVKRAGARIANAIQNAIVIAELHGKILIRGDFLWTAGDRLPTVRRRKGSLSTRMELICDEEIEEALNIVLRHQGTTSVDTLITQTSRLFGIQATRETTSARIKSSIEGLVKKGAIEHLPNAMVASVLAKPVG